MNGSVFIQYWLIGYFANDTQFAGSCPNGAQHYDNGSYQGTTVVHQYDCFWNGPSKPTPVYSTADLAGLAISGLAGTYDQVALYTDVGGELVSIAANPTTVLNLSEWWTSAEFNVFGPGSGVGGGLELRHVDGRSARDGRRRQQPDPADVHGEQLHGEINNLDRGAGVVLHDSGGRILGFSSRRATCRGRRHALLVSRRSEKAPVTLRDSRSSANIGTSMTSEAAGRPWLRARGCDSRRPRTRARACT